ncbi:uncharacterized protein N7477_008685 [Penicillium maclennaniae]|uniref:uncharacterized protein n=1 Tax=Penicillium maclennaniae TaxID=1343394 RepID=UPI0025421DD6|nr:uncharacterized protein N7477_008685 [Penicillium maclennaniae]KAJ5666237.1 hypothetical protein N7477_008685 [Penicillium maclennaniae]
MTNAVNVSRNGMHWAEQVLAYTQALPMPGTPKDATVRTDSDSSEYEYAAAAESLTGSPFGPLEDLTPEEYLGRFWNQHKWYSTPAGTRYVAHAPRNPADVSVQFFGNIGGTAGYTSVVENSSVDNNLSSKNHSLVDIATGPSGKGVKRASKKGMMKKPVPKPTATNTSTKPSSKMLSPTTTLSGSAPLSIISSISAHLPSSGFPAEAVWDDTSSRPWTKVVNKKKEVALKKASVRASSNSQTFKNVKVSPNPKIKTAGSGYSPAQRAPPTSSIIAQQKGKKKEPAAPSSVPMDLPPCLAAISPPKSAPVCSSHSRPAPASSTSRAVSVSSSPCTSSIVPSHHPAPIAPENLNLVSSPLRLALDSCSPRLTPVSPFRPDSVAPTFLVEPGKTSSHSSDGSSSSIEIITERPSSDDTYRGTSEENVEKAPRVPTCAAIISTSAPAALATVENTRPFVIETETWLKKIAQTQPRIDEAVTAAKQAWDTHEDEKRRVLADAHLKLVEIARQHAHQNPQIAFGNPNALPWPLGMPLMTDDEYREAGRSYPDGEPAMEKAAGYTYWQSESSHPRSAVIYPHMTQHTDQGMHVFTWTRMSELGYDYLEAFRSDPAKCWFNPPCCQHRHPYAPRTDTPLHWVDGCCCAHDPSRCCNCLTLEMQNAVPEPGLPWGNIPDERTGHDFRDQPVGVSERLQPFNSGYPTPSRRLAAQSSPERPGGIGNWPFGSAMLPPANLTGYGYHNPGDSGEWGLINQTGHALSIPFRGYAHGVSGQYGPIHNGYIGQYIRNAGPSSFFARIDLDMEGTIETRVPLAAISMADLGLDLDLPW